MKLIFLMDPIGSIDINGDSTFVLMLEAQERGHEVLYAHPRALELHGGEARQAGGLEVWVSAHPVKVRRAADHYTEGEVERLSLSDVDAVFMRKDPPIDINYIAYTYILEHVDRDRVVMINDPQGLRDFNEKFSALHWPHLVPRSVVTSDLSQIRSLIAEMGCAVVKPLMNAGGAGVMRLSKGDENTAAILDLITANGTRPIQVQAFLPSISEGDKRIILIDGEAVGAVNRLPQEGDHRANLHVGAVAEKGVLTDRDLEICRAIGPSLKRRGLVFAGIDVIGGFLTEINVTSPTGLQEINRFDGVSLEGRLIDWVEQRHRQLNPQ